MNLTEKVLAKLDEYVHYNEGSPIWLALRRQVEKHKEVDGKCAVCEGVYYASTAMVGSIRYPCTFIKEVAIDLGIEVGE